MCFIICLLLYRLQLWWTIVHQLAPVCIVSYRNSNFAKSRSRVLTQNARKGLAALSLITRDKLFLSTLFERWPISNYFWQSLSIDVLNSFMQNRKVMVQTNANRFGIQKFLYLCLRCCVFVCCRFLVNKDLCKTEHRWHFWTDTLFAVCWERGTLCKRNLGLMFRVGT